MTVKIEPSTEVKTDAQAEPPPDDEYTSASYTMEQSEEEPESRRPQGRVET